MTDLGYYADLLGGGARVSTFREGIRAVVRPGDRVLDLGSGLGTYAFYAARAGAGKVWTVERDAVHHVAQALADANDLSGRVVCVRGDGAELDLPSGVDALIFEDFTRMLLDARTHALLTRVQAVELAKGGVMVPRAGRTTSTGRRCTGRWRTTRAARSWRPRSRWRPRYDRRSCPWCRSRILGG